MDRDLASRVRGVTLDEDSSRPRSCPERSRPARKKRECEKRNEATPRREQESNEAGRPRKSGLPVPPASRTRCGYRYSNLNTCARCTETSPFVSRRDPSTRAMSSVGIALATVQLMALLLTI